MAQEDAILQPDKGTSETRSIRSLANPKWNSFACCPDPSDDSFLYNWIDGQDMFSASCELFAHDFSNPHHGADIDISFEDSSEYLSLERQSKGFTNKYELEIKQPDRFGIARRNFEKELRILFTALNLMVDHVCFSRYNTSVGDFQFNDPRRPYKDRGPRQMPVSSKLSHEFDESDLLYIFDKLVESGRTEHILDDTKQSRIEFGGPKEPISNDDRLESVDEFRSRFGARSVDEIDIEYQNLMKSIDAYDIAMRTRSRQVQHVFLFISLETCVNISEDSSGRALEEKMSESAGIPIENIRLWRSLYHRQKHGDRNNSDLKSSSLIVEDILGVAELRSGAIKAILGELGMDVVFESEHE